MGNDLEKGTTYGEGDQVNALNLNAHVDNATIKYTAISSKTLKDPASASDELLINDAGILKKITLQQISAFVTIPVGTVHDYAGTTEPTGWLFCYGQAISRVTYAGLFDVIGEAFGSGDGSSTFNLPDCRGRTSIGKDDMGTVSANRITLFDGDVLGGVGGTESHVLTEAQLAYHQHNGASHTHAGPNHRHYHEHTHSYTIFSLGTPGFGTAPGGQVMGLVAGTGTSGASDPYTQYEGTGQTGGPTATATDHRGSNAAHPNIQPSIVFNKIIKI